MNGGRANGCGEEPPPDGLDGELRSLLDGFKRTPPREDLVQLVERLKEAFADKPEKSRPS